MTNLPAPAHLGKSVHVKISQPLLPSLAEDLDGSTLPEGVYRSIRIGPPVQLPPEMFAQLPPGSACTVAAYLDSECERVAGRRETPVYGIFHSLRRIADETHLSISAVRATALPWLIAQGWVEAEEFTSAAGHPCTMLWCKWRFPHYLDGATIETGAGVKLQVEPDRIAVIPSSEGARKSARLGGRGARFFAPDYKREFNTQKKTTTDADGGTLLFSSEGEEKGDQCPQPSPTIQADPPSPESVLAPSPAPALPVELSEAIDEATDRVGVRTKLAAEAAAWVGKVELAWLRLAILEYAAKSRLADDPRPIVHPARWVRGILQTWLDAGQPMPVLAREALEVARKQAAAKEAAAKEAAAAAVKRADRAKEAEIDARMDRWRALSDVDKGPLRAEFERIDPPPSDRVLARMWLVKRDGWCAQALADREVSR